MEKKALFLDMDGTTLNDQVEIPKENLEAMKAALKAGHEIVVTTGRPTASTRKLLEQWGLDKIGCRYVISFNGGMVLDAISGDIIYEKTIPVEWMKLVAHEAKQRGVYVHTYEGNHVLSGQDCDEYRSYVKRLRMEGRLVSDLEESIEKEACKLLAVDLKIMRSWKISGKLCRINLKESWICFSVTVSIWRSCRVVYPKALLWKHSVQKWEFPLPILFLQGMRTTIFL